MGNARWTGVRLRDVLDRPDDRFWTKTACRIPDTPNADVRPGETGFATVPISRMNPRSRVTNLRAGRTVPPDAPWPCAASRSAATPGWHASTSPPTAARAGSRRRSAPTRAAAASAAGRATLPALCAASPGPAPAPAAGAGPGTAPVTARDGVPAPMVFRLESVGLPVGDRVLPGGAPAGATDANCVTCHSAGMVLNQPPLRRAEWTAEVGRMARVCKAPVSPEDQAAIIDDLAATKGRS